MPLNLETLHEAVLATYMKDGFHASTLFGFNGGRVTTVVVFLPIDDREQMLGGLAALLAENGCDSYGVVSEAWANEPDELRGKLMQPSKDPSRIEVLMVTRVFPDGHWVCDNWEIDKGKVVGYLEDYSTDSSELAVDANKEVHNMWAALLRGKGTATW